MTDPPLAIVVPPWSATCKEVLLSKGTQPDPPNVAVQPTDTLTGAPNGELHLTAADPPCAPGCISIWPEPLRVMEEPEVPE